MPAKELIIMEMVEYELSKLAETSALLIEAGHPIILNWAEGVTFYHRPLPFNSKDLMKERMRGRVYWANVIYAKMPQYIPVIKVGTRDIPVVATPNPVLKHVACWLKERLGKNII
jgi:hypothetical protein